MNALELDGSRESYFALPVSDEIVAKMSLKRYMYFC